MSRAACRLCGGALSPVRGLAFPDLAVTRCRGCALVHLERFSEPPPYFAQALAAFRADPEGWLAARHYGLVDHLEALVGPGAGRRLMDVGCSFGAVVHEARRRGWDAEGIDTSAEAVSEGAHHTHGLHHADLDHHPFPSASFDAVVIWHVLEHIPRPDQALEAITRLLKPGGVLFLEVPNLASPIAWLVYRRRWLGFETPDHLFAFTRATLGPLVERAGLTIESVRCPVIAAYFPGGWKGALRRVLFDLAAALDCGDGLRVVARKRSC